MIKLQTLMKERPIEPLDNAVWWTEHVIKYGGDHLLSPANHMTYIEYYEAELILIFLSILLVSVASIVFILKKTLNIVNKYFIISYKIKLH